MTAEKFVKKMLSKENMQKIYFDKDKDKETYVG